jgi:hypothetical protein
MEQIRWLKGPDQAMAQASSEQKMLLLDFTAAPQ